VQPMMLAFSIVLGILPLGGIAWTIANGTIFTVDGLFMTLILLTLSGLFFLNAFWECRDCGHLWSTDTREGARRRFDAA